MFHSCRHTQDACSANKESFGRLTPCKLRNIVTAYKWRTFLNYLAGLSELSTYFSLSWRSRWLVRRSVCLPHGAPIAARKLSRTLACILTYHSLHVHGTCRNKCMLNFEDSPTVASLTEISQEIVTSLWSASIPTLTEYHMTAWGLAKCRIRERKNWILLHD